MDLHIKTNRHDEEIPFDIRIKKTESLFMNVSFSKRSETNYMDDSKGHETS